MCSQISHEFPLVDVETCIMMLLLMFHAKSKSAKCLRSPLLVTSRPTIIFNVAAPPPQKKNQLEKLSMP